MHKQKHKHITSLGIFVFCVASLLREWVHLEAGVDRHPLDLHKASVDGGDIRLEGHFRLDAGWLHPIVILLGHRIHILLLLELHLLVLFGHHPHLLRGVHGGDAQLLLLSGVEEVEGLEYALALFVVLEDLQNLLGGLFGNVVAVFALYEFLSLLVEDAIKVLVVDVLNVDPLEFEVALELAVLILPPEREGLVVVARNQASDTLKMTTLDSTEE